MLKRFFVFSLFLMGFASMSLASVGGESKYVKLYIFDAATNGAVTRNTTHINAFVDFIDMDDYKKNEAIPANNNLKVSNPNGNGYTAYSVNDLQNNSGTIQQLKAGEIPTTGLVIGGNGNTSVYLGEYLIEPNQSRSFVGGVVLQFNFVVTSGTATNSTSTNLYASEVVPFNMGEVVSLQ